MDFRCFPMHLMDLVYVYTIVAFRLINVLNLMELGIEAEVFVICTLYISFNIIINRKTKFKCTKVLKYKNHKKNIF